MSYVLDASIALSWCFQDEATATTDMLLEKAREEVIYAPVIWPLEITNVLLGAEKKNRITYAEMTLLIDLLQKLQIEIDEGAVFRSFTDILSLAHAEGLTSYDAAYLELALRKNLPLATKDKQLLRVAKSLGVATYNN